MVRANSIGCLQNRYSIIYTDSMNENPLISVIIPVYNVESYIEQCLRSVMTQTYNNIEIIAVDDGSTDNSGKICDDLAKEDARIKVIHQTNSGVSVARNTGMDAAHGEYVGFVDGDDFIDPDMYEYLYSLIKDNNADISYCRFRHYGFPNAWQYADDERIGFEILDGVSALRAWFEGKHNITGYCWDGLHNRRVLVKFPIGLFSQDREFKAKTLLNASVVISGKEIKYNYRFRPNSTVHGGDFKKRATDLHIIYNDIEKAVKPLNNSFILLSLYRMALKHSVSYLSESIHSNLSGIPEIRFLIRTYASLVYSGREKWKAKLICMLMMINAVWPYKVAISISDFILGVIKKRKAIKKSSVSK